jgi:hypothetical protein
VKSTTNSIAITVLLGILNSLPSAAEDYKPRAEEKIPSGIRVARLVAARDEQAPSKDAAALYRSECGSCHVLYPPILLSDVSGWKEIMDDLRDHFGENAELEEAVHPLIRRYLVDNAASNGRRFGSRTIPARLTSTLWFHRTHGEVKQYFRIAPVGSQANCMVCHPRAEHWIYSKSEVRLPTGLQR